MAGKPHPTSLRSIEYDAGRAAAPQRTTQPARRLKTSDTSCFFPSPLILPLLRFPFPISLAAISPSLLLLLLPQTQAFDSPARALEPAFRAVVVASLGAASHG